MKKSLFQGYTVALICVVTILLALIWQLYGDAHVINYTGIVRGCTQKLVKEELRYCPNDTTVAYLDDIFYDLQTGDGEYGLTKVNSDKFQNQLTDLQTTWTLLKKQIVKFRQDGSGKSTLYDLSELHYLQSDELVHIAEEESNNKLVRFVIFYGMSIVLGLIAFFVISKKTHKKLEKSRTTDLLTGALNVRAFEVEASKIVEENKEKQFAVVVFDIKNFKSINTAHGYSTGDQVLLNLTRSLVRHTEPGILTARVIFDEFVVLVEQTENIAEILWGILVEAMTLSRLSHYQYLSEISLRCGACVVSQGDEPVKMAMDQATTAHKLAKAEGNSIVWCDKNLVERLNRETYCQDHFQQAIKEKEFQLYLQSQVDLKTGEKVGAESLVRWKLPSGQVMFPDEFIPMFEREGLIKTLDFYMLEMVCAYLQHQEKPWHIISVNFSRVTLQTPNFVARVLAVVDQYQIPHHCIGIEIVETALNKMGEQTIADLQTLKSAGFKLAMDDFGAGYSSLSILSNLPVQVIKLDKQFLWSIAENPKMSQIITHVVDMAHGIGLQVVCEGVEEEHQVAYLQSIGCDIAQGYFYAKPQPAKWPT